ncbi:hypothetical protein TNCT_453841 [Trichonephila clavata]|uniref:Uncharacterized protein n=1 Tax=Trichonephila clavata TaxID=2740835 RepID=A0A8X6L6L1_TRICU|nr:hypothetical protein TNCT_453841 [Trichonephila clavata]
MPSLLDHSDMDVSLRKDEKISACERLRNTVTSISALHKNLQDDERFRTPSPRNPKTSFLDLYRLNAEVMMRKRKICAIYHVIGEIQRMWLKNRASWPETQDSDFTDALELATKERQPTITTNLSLNESDSKLFE